MQRKDQFRLHLLRIDPSRNMARFYELALEDGLFGEVLITRRWGRLGTHGRSKTQFANSEIEGLEILLALLRAKRCRGYRPAGVGQAA